MSNIIENLQKILSARFGRDVRQAIHDAIHDCYEDGKAGAIDLVAREEKFDKAGGVVTGATTFERYIDIGTSSSVNSKIRFYDSNRENNPVFVGYDNSNGSFYIYDKKNGKAILQCSADGTIKFDGKTMPSVINNLTSDSTTDALSAAQGKFLRGIVPTYIYPTQYYFDGDVLAQALALKNSGYAVVFGYSGGNTTNLPKLTSAWRNASIEMRRRGDSIWVIAHDHNNSAIAVNYYNGSWGGWKGVALSAIVS